MPFFPPSNNCFAFIIANYERVAFIIANLRYSCLVLFQKWNKTIQRGMNVCVLREIIWNLIGHSREEYCVCWSYCVVILFFQESMQAIASLVTSDNVHSPFKTLHICNETLHQSPNWRLLCCKKVLPIPTSAYHSSALPLDLGCSGQLHLFPSAPSRLYGRMSGQTQLPRASMCTDQVKKKAAAAWGNGKRCLQAVAYWELLYILKLVFNTVLWLYFP